MRQMRSLLAVICGAALLACSPRTELAPAALDVAALRAQAEENGSVRVIARLAEGREGQPASADDRTAALAVLSAMGVAEPQAISPALPLVVAEVTPAQLDAMASSGRFERVVEDELAFISLAESGPLVGAPEAWSIGARGAGEAVAILDTGVDAAHPFLRGRVVEEACFSSRSAAQGGAPVCPNGETRQTGEGAARPCGAAGCEHGTHVAGIAAGRGARFSGMAPDADIIAIQVFTQFSDVAGGPAPCRGGGQPSPCIASFTSDQIRALDYLRQLSLQRPIAAANMSLGGGRSATACDSDMTKDVIDQLRAAGITTVIAAGNNGFPDAVSRPGCISTAVTVGATDKQDRLAPFSNNGPLVDILAPGVGVQSSVPGGGFAAFSGTSMAAPHVAGAITALRSLSPQATVEDVERALLRSGVAVGARPRLALYAAARDLRPAPAEENVEIASDTASLQAAIAQIEALPPDQPVRMMARVRAPAAATAQAMAQAMSEARAAARAAGITQVDTLGAQPILVFEATPAQAAALARSGAISGLQADTLARPQ